MRESSVRRTKQWGLAWALLGLFAGLTCRRRGLT